jgi:hypothetical protein
MTPVAARLVSPNPLNPMAECTIRSVSGAQGKVAWPGRFARANGAAQDRGDGRLSTFRPYRRRFA